MEQFLKPIASDLETKRRSQIEIIGNILKFCQGKWQARFHIIRDVILSHKQLQELLPSLVNNGFLCEVPEEYGESRTRSVFTTTDEGVFLLTAIENLVKLLKDVS